MTYSAITNPGFVQFYFVSVPAELLSTVLLDNNNLSLSQPAKES